MFIQTEATPNPATLKFLPGKVVMPEGTFDARDAAGAAPSPLAQRLFEIPGIAGVFFGYDFITVTKGEGEWQHLKPAILGAIMEHFMSGAPIVIGGDRPGGRCRRRGVLRRGRRADGRDHQGTARDPHPPGGRRGRRRHHLPRLQGRRRLPEHEGRLLGLPVLDRDPQARHPEPPAPLPARRARGRGGLTPNPA